MDIYLTNLDTGDSFRFPMLPEEIHLSLGNQFASYSILGLGEVRAPSGVALDSVSWEGIFPGESRQDMPFIREWVTPQEAFRWIEECKVALPSTKKLQLLITETTINLEVYLESFQKTYSAGMGDIGYSITLIQAKDLTVTATSSTSLGDAASTEDNRSTPTITSYTVVKGDNLWTIAQRFLGAGSRFGEIYELNKDIIGENNSKYVIYPGQVFTLPT